MKNKLCGASSLCDLASMWGKVTNLPHFKYHKGGVLLYMVIEITQYTIRIVRDDMIHRFIQGPESQRESPAEL